MDRVLNWTVKMLCIRVILIRTCDSCPIKLLHNWTLEEKAAGVHDTSWPLLQSKNAQMIPHAAKRTKKPLADANGTWTYIIKRHILLYWIYWKPHNGKRIRGQSTPESTCVKTLVFALRDKESDSDDDFKITRQDGKTEWRSTELWEFRSWTFQHLTWNDSPQTHSFRRMLKMNINIYSTVWKQMIIQCYYTII